MMDSIRTPSSHLQPVTPVWVDRMDKEVNYWPTWEEMLILRDRVEEFYSLMVGDNCVLSSVTWIFLQVLGGPGEGVHIGAEECRET